MRSVSIVGCGYTGLRLAVRCAGMGAGVRGFAARAESLARIAAAGIEAHRLNLDAASDPLDMSDQYIYYAVPPPAQGSGDPRLERFLDSCQGAPARLIYLSTTGVYGDQGGATVAEDTPPQPKTLRAQRRLAAETALRIWAEARGISWCILRLPGIYGPGRLPLDRLRSGSPAIVPAEATPGNRIHVTDLVTACLAAGEEPRAHRNIYNVTDGTGDSLTEYLQRVARIAHLPPPPLISRAEAQRSFSASSWSFLGESRRVDNRRMLDELNVALHYRDLDAGIRASLDDADQAG